MINNIKNIENYLKQNKNIVLTEKNAPTNTDIRKQNFDDYIQASKTFTIIDTNDYSKKEIECYYIIEKNQTLANNLIICEGAVSQDELLMLLLALNIIDSFEFHQLCKDQYRNSVKNT